MTQKEMELFDGTGVIWIAVSDLEAAKGWYEKALKAQFFLQPRPNQWIGFGPVKDLGIGLTEVTPEDLIVSHISPFTVGVSSIADTKLHFKSMGMSPSESVDTPGVGRVAVFLDLDGHKITFFESAQKPR